MSLETDWCFYKELNMGFFGFGKLKKREFATLAENLISQQVIEVNIKDVYKLVLALEKALVNLIGLDAREASHQAIENLKLACPKCGKLSDQAKDLVLIEFQEDSVKEMKDFLFGSLVGTLGKGMCPSCKGTKVNVSFTTSG